MRSKEVKPWLHVRITEGSGIDSGKTGVILPESHASARKLSQEYPFIGGRTMRGMHWSAIMLDNGTATAMPYSRLQRIKPEDK
jgi:hypothetical protein